MTELLGIAVCVLFCSLIIKDVNRQFALVLSISGVCIILLSIVGEAKQLVDEIRGISDLYSDNASYIKLMLKALIITLITQIVSDLCRDNGESALAGVTEFSAKIIVVSMVLPLFKTIITIVGGFIK